MDPVRSLSGKSIHNSQFPIIQIKSFKIYIPLELYQHYVITIQDIRKGIMKVKDVNCKTLTGYINQLLLTGWNNYSAI